MLILLFIFALIRHLHGAPTPTLPIPGSDLSDIFTRDDPINHHLGTRQLSDIIISCLATIFACTWTAIHPNIPGPCDSGWEIFKRQVTTMIYAILAPEAITGWALRQNLAARRISRNYNEKLGQHHKLIEVRKEGWFRRKYLPPAPGNGEAVAWTITHGFFQQMGGFILRRHGQSVGVAVGVWIAVRDGQVSPPSITEAEIEDRSKGDGLTKTFIVLQTTWFIAQCIVRWSSGLPVTELEVVTLGFAMLNGITYGLWWNKPQSVGLPVYLEMKDSEGAGEKGGTVSVVEKRERGEERPSQPTEDQTIASLDEEGHSMVEAQVVEGGEDVVEKRESPGEGQTEQIRGTVQSRGTQDEGQGQPVEDQTVAPAGEEQQVDVEEQAVEGKPGVVKERERPGKGQSDHTNSQKGTPEEEKPPPGKRSYLSEKLKKDRRTRWQLIWRIPYRLIQAALRPLARMMDFSRTGVYTDDLRVATFYSSGVDSEAVVYIGSSAIASIFGLIHLIPAWFLHFPSRPEMILWRVSAGIITAQPIILGIWSWKERGAIWDGPSKSSTLGILAVSGLPLYITARLALIVLALISIRKLDKDTLVAIDWISFIPHI